MTAAGSMRTFHIDGHQVDVTITADRTGAVTAVHLADGRTFTSTLAAETGHRYSDDDFATIAEGTAKLVAHFGNEPGPIKQWVRRFEIGGLTLWAHRDTSPPTWKLPRILCRRTDGVLRIGAGWRNTALSLSIQPTRHLEPATQRRSR